MEVLFSYKQDDSLFLKREMILNNVSLTIESITDAGRAEAGEQPKPNEDAFSAVQQGNEIVVAVFDGATGQKVIPELEPTTSARFASHKLKEILETLKSIGDGKTIISQLNRDLGDALKTLPSVNLADVNSLPTSTATIVKIDSNKQIIETAHVGDSFAVALMKNGETRLLTNNLHRPFDEKVLGLISEIAAEQNISQREARKDPRIRQAIIASHQFERNRPDGKGSGSVNSDPAMDGYIYTSSVPLAEVEAVVLGSDGLLPPDRSEQSSDDQKWLFETIEQKGLEGLVQTIRQIEDTDPDWQQIRYKHSDDATGILIRIKT